MQSGACSSIRVVAQYHMPSRSASGRKTSLVCRAKTSFRATSSSHVSRSPPRCSKASSAPSLVPPSSSRADSCGAADSASSPSGAPATAACSSRIETSRDASEMNIESETSQPASRIWHCRSKRSASASSAVAPSAALALGGCPRTSAAAAASASASSAPRSASPRSSRRESFHTLETPNPTCHREPAAAPSTASMSKAVTPVSLTPASSAASTIDASARMDTSTRATARTCLSLSTSPAAVSAW